MMGGVQFESGAVLMELQKQEDDRGWTIQTGVPIELTSLGVPTEWPYELVSYSHEKVLRGLHHQPGLAKIVHAIRGRLHEVVVDLRAESFGAVEEYLLTPEQQLYVPPWCAQGYVVLDSGAEVHYRLSTRREPAIELTILWSSIDHVWPFDPTAAYFMSNPDAMAPTLAEVRERLWPHVSEAVEARAT